jgi:2-iminobutanoate/2-iminopropanoate deaminase
VQRKQVIVSAQAPAAIGPYSQAIRTSGFIFTSAVIPLDPATGEVDGVDIERQAERVMRNLAGLLHDAGSSLSQVVKTTCFLADLDHFPSFNDIYARHFRNDGSEDGALPARSTVQVAGLPLGVLVEVECVALAAPS